VYIANSAEDLRAASSAIEPIGRFQGLLIVTKRDVASV
jgi:hypothetical protein